MTDIHKANYDLADHSLKLPDGTLVAKLGEEVSAEQAFTLAGATTALFDKDWEGHLKFKPKGYGNEVHIISDWELQELTDDRDEDDL